jgi:hypothetical protein
MPGRDHQLEQVDDMVGMHMGQQHRIDIADPRLRHPLGHAGPAIDQEGGIPVAHDLRRAVTFSVDGRTAGAEKGELHEGIPESGKNVC